MKDIIPKKEPWFPPDYELADIMAIKNLFAGTATEDQQKRGMNWIVMALCGTYDLSFRPDSERSTAFAEGRRFVGLEIIKALKLNTEIIRRTDK